MADFITQHHKPSIGYVEPCLGHYSLMDHRASKGWHWYCYYFASGASFEFAFQTKRVTTYNQAEYEAILKGLQLVQ